MVSQSDRATPKAPLTYCPIRRALIAAGYLQAPPQRAAQRQRANTAPDPRAVSPATGRAP